MAKKKKADKVRERKERRFTPLPAMSQNVLNAFGGISAAVLGAGVFAQFGHGWLDNPAPPYSFAPAMIAGGAVAFGAAVWLGTSGEAVLRVGAGGIAIEKANDVARIAWHKVERIAWDPDRTVLEVRGKDEGGRMQALALSPKVYPGAIGWIVKEARSRIPLEVDVPDEAHGLPVAEQGDGELLTMEPFQVVGKRCAESDRVIAYEPDARVCTRCERVYYRLAVPEACECGAALDALRGDTQADAKADSTKPEPSGEEAQPRKDEPAIAPVAAEAATSEPAKAEES
jgi:hypothetical protein